MKRRDFLSGLALTSASLAAANVVGKTNGNSSPIEQAATPPASGRNNIIICAANGYQYIDSGYQFLAQGADTLDAAIKVVSGPENDPNDNSVGLGGLPNEDGVVELDACCMHGPTRRAGSVGGVRDIKNVAALSKAVMEHTGHVMLVGEGAERFAVAMGFPRENLLTENSRKVWMLWKQFHSTDDWWGPGLADPHWTAPETKPHSQLWPERFKKLEELAAGVGIEPE